MCLNSQEDQTNNMITILGIKKDQPGQTKLQGQGIFEEDQVEKDEKNLLDLTRQVGKARQEFYCCN